MSIAATSTEQKLQSIAATRLKIPIEEVPLDQSLMDDMGLDSFDMMGIILEIQETFAPVTIADKSAEDMVTLREVARYIDDELCKLR